MEIDVEGADNVSTNGEVPTQVEGRHTPESGKDETVAAVETGLGKSDNRSAGESTEMSMKSETPKSDATLENGDGNSGSSEAIEQPDKNPEPEEIVEPRNTPTDGGTPLPKTTEDDSWNIDAAEPDQVDNAVSVTSKKENVNPESTSVKNLNEATADAEGRYSSEEEDDEPASLEVIDKKREEEKQTFQKLIEESARLEKRVEFLENCKSELETRLDVCKIELTTYKEQCSYQKEQIELLEKQNKSKAPSTPLPSIVRPVQEPTLSGGDNDTTNLMNTIKETHEEREQLRKQLEESNNSSQKNQLEVKELKLRIQRMSADDQIKTDRIHRLEADLADKSQTLERVETELGAERMNRLKSTSNGASAHGGKANTESNVITPKEKSGICIIS